jgi:hypothetical protein
LILAIVFWVLAKEMQLGGSAARQLGFSFAVAGAPF